MRSPRERILDILDAIEDIEKYSSSGIMSQLEDEKTRTWYLYNFIIIGEASANLSDEFKEKYSHVPWHKIIGLRNVLVHGYFKIELGEIWSAAVNDLPRL